MGNSLSNITHCSFTCAKRKHFRLISSQNNASVEQIVLKSSSTRESLMDAVLPPLIHYLRACSTSTCTSTARGIFRLTNTFVRSSGRSSRFNQTHARHEGILAFQQVVVQQPVHVLDAPLHVLLHCAPKRFVVLAVSASSRVSAPVRNRLKFCGSMTSSARKYLS